MKQLLYLILLLVITSSCGCEWASKNCPGETITDTIVRVEIHDTTFYDTTIQPLPDRVLRLKAMALIDSLGYVQLPETTVTDQYGNSICVKIEYDTVYAESVNRDSLITVLKSNIRKELRSEHTKFIQVKTEKPKKTINVYGRIVLALVLTIVILSLVYLIFKRYAWLISR